MTFAGIQKLTLIDYPDKPACTLFSAGCNFACPFCHNPSLIPFPNSAADEAGEYFTQEYILDFLKTRQGFIEAVCLSGGEPLVNSTIADFADKVKAMGYLIKIDTNGSNPKLLRELIESGRVDYVAMDVKNTFNKYAQTAGVPGYDTKATEESIEYLLSGGIPYEFRTTVVRELHTAEDLVSVAEMIKGADKYFLQSFEKKGDVLQPGLSAYTEDEMQEILKSVQSVLPCTVIRNQ